MFGVETGSFSGNEGTKVVAVNGTHPNHSDLEIKTLFKQISARLITHLNSRFLNRDLPGKIWSTSTFETVTKNQGETFLIHDCGAYCLLNNVKPCMAFNVE
jgi:hypothetical protein